MCTDSTQCTRCAHGARARLRAPTVGAQNFVLQLRFLGLLLLVYFVVVYETRNRIECPTGEACFTEFIFFISLLDIICQATYPLLT